MIIPGLTSTDGVVVLDRHTDADLAAHLAGEDEETARRFGWWPERSTEATVRAVFARWAQDWETSGPTRTFALRDTVTGRLLGGCELRLQPDGSAHVSYWTSVGKRGRGYATRALTLLLAYADSVGVARLEAHVAVDNVASRRVAEKADFRTVGSFRAGDGTVMIRYETSSSPLPVGPPGGAVPDPVPERPESVRFLSGVILVSRDPERLVEFYRDTLGVPLVEERHGDTAPHWGCELGDVHFAIHPVEDYPDAPIATGAVKLAFMVFDLAGLVDWLDDCGVALCYPPTDFGTESRITAVWDPDGNLVELTQLGPSWLHHLEDRRAGGHDLVRGWSGPVRAGGARHTGAT